jgi:hypothetical protein
MLGKLGVRDSIPLRRFVTDLNLAPEILITWPLKDRNRFSKWEICYSTENDTDSDANMGCYLATQRRGILRVYESLAPASHRSFESKAKASVRVQEEDRQLQFRLRDVLSYVGNGMRNPQSLRHHSSTAHNHTVEYPSVLVGELISDMLGNGWDNEGNAILPRMTRGGDVVVLQ